MSRMRMGSQQEIETLISEEAMLFAQYLRNEKVKWIPRIALPLEPISIRNILDST